MGMKEEPLTWFARQKWLFKVVELQSYLPSRKELGDCNTSIINEESILSYVKRITDQVSKILRKNDVRIIFKPYSTTRNSFGFSERLLSSNDKCCVRGNVRLIGQISGLVTTQISEHIRTSKNNTHRSAIAEHLGTTRHLIKFEKARAS